MDNHHSHGGRRNRKYRECGYDRNYCCNYPYLPRSQSCSLCGTIYNFMIMASLLGLIYLMLDYHCYTCKSGQDMNLMASDIRNIVGNITKIYQSYHDLETKISKFSQDLPKIEGQVEILEALANTIESKEFGWNPNTHLTLPNVDVYLNQLENGRNISRKVSKHLPNTFAVN